MTNKAKRAEGYSKRIKCSANMPTYLCIYRILKRRLMYHGKSRPDMNEGCPEQLDWNFIKWVWSYNKDKKPKILKKLKIYSNQKNVIIFNNSSEVDNFISDLKNNKFKKW